MSLLGVCGQAVSAMYPGEPDNEEGVCINVLKYHFYKKKKKGNSLK